MSTATARSLGRFELRRELGRGAKAQVWLAFDPRLDRDVALKLLDPQADAALTGEWLHEARAVSRLTHPNVVPVFEADEQSGQRYLVFEYVPGRTLAEALRSRVAMSASEAVAMMLAVLDALAAAHQQGIVHRDLKPSNILIGEDGRVRVMDFGIAARSAGPAGLVVGTPGNISPEAVRGESPSPAMDVFAAGMVLCEMLAGGPLLADSDPMRALGRVQQQDPQLPSDAAVDDSLRAIVERAIARDPVRRWGQAQAMRDALAGWQAPVAADQAEAAGHGTLDFLLRRMRHKGDFPALSDSVLRIQRVASSETGSLGSLANEILQDVALTNKLLRMVNTAHFGGGEVSTVSRAVALVGFAGIRNMAFSLVLLEHMRDKAHAARLKDEFVHALLAGMLADALTPSPREGEEAFLGSMFQNLGRLLTEYYFPEEALQIREQLPATGATIAQREAAATRVLGTGFEEMGVGVARSWCLPAMLQRAMRVPVGAAPHRLVERGPERQRWAGRAANQMADSMLSLESEALTPRLRRLAADYAAALGLDAEAIVAAAEHSRARLMQLVPAMGLQTTAGSAARRLMRDTATVTDSLSPHQLQSTVAMHQAAGVAETRPVADVLAAGIQDITNSMVAEDFKLNEVLRMVLETMYRALAFRRVVFCLREPKTDMLTGRFGLGEGAEAASRVLRVPLNANTGTDLFAAVCAKGMDTLIADATAPNIAARLPAWYRQTIAAPAFLLLPMARKNATFALIYADKAVAGTIALGEKELSLLRTLRNQAVMAFRQSGAGLGSAGAAPPAPARKG